MPARSAAGIPEGTAILVEAFYDGDRLAGFIELYKLSGREFTGSDEAIVCRFADLASICLNQASHLADSRNFEMHLTEILLQTLELRLPFKRLHAERVAGYSQLMATALGLSFERCRKLRVASLLHDIGFIRVPVLKQSDKCVYVRHATEAHRLLSRLSCYEEIADIVLHHHERYDGSGYPDSRKGEDIPLESRIIAVADAFEAMTSDTSYRQCTSASAALWELSQQAGSQFDPHLVEVFINAVYREKARAATSAGDGAGNSVSDAAKI